jgi:hypothetical protein
MKSLLLFALLTMCAAATAGCHNVQTRSYDISVKNDSTKTVILWLTKNGPPWENGWKSPEEIAVESPRADEPFPFQTVPAGKTATATNVKGQFDAGTDAILRVYVGQYNFNELLAINRDSPSRIEVKLTPGANQFQVVDSGGLVSVNRVGP